ncbi:MAG TPA: hypothetical protein VEH28_03820 [Thermoplasmata archaeon]|nr:hypothetical protein [Thermoplasmata archaeon]
MNLPFPSLLFTPSLVPFAVIALAMIGITVFLLGKVLPADGRPPLVTQMVIALAVLGGGSLLLLSLLFVFLNPNATESWTFVLLAFNFMMMFPAGIWFVGLVVFRDRRIDAGSWFWPATLAVVTTGSEALMGVLFAYGTVAGPTTTLAALATGLTSVWFFWSMAAVMAALLLWAPLGRLERWALVTLAAAAVLGPWVTSFPLIGGLLMAVLMAFAFVALIRSLQRGDVAPNEGRLLVAVAAAFLSMTVSGLLVAFTAGAVTSSLAFGSVMGIVMGVEVAYLIRRYYRGRMARPWLVRSVEETDTLAAGAPPPWESHRDSRPGERPTP